MSGFKTLGEIDPLEEGESVIVKYDNWPSGKTRFIGGAVEDFQQTSDSGRMTFVRDDNGQTNHVTLRHQLEVEADRGSPQRVGENVRVKRS